LKGKVAGTPYFCWETPWFPVDFPFQKYVFEAVAERDAPGLHALTKRFEVEQQRCQVVKRCRVMELGRPSGKNGARTARPCHKANSQDLYWGMVLGAVGLPLWVM